MRPVEPRFCATGREVGSSAILNTGWADGLAAPGDGQRRGAVHVACRQREPRTPGARRSGRSLGASASGTWAAFAPARRTANREPPPCTSGRCVSGAHPRLWQIATRFLAPPGQGPPPDRQGPRKGGYRM